MRRIGRKGPLHLPGVQVAGHAPFCCGPMVAEAAHNAVVVEALAAMVLNTVMANPRARILSKILHEKHFFRKHGNAAYYGQKKGS